MEAMSEGEGVKPCPETDFTPEGAMVRSYLPGDIPRFLGRREASRTALSEMLRSANLNCMMAFLFLGFPESGIVTWKCRGEGRGWLEAFR